MRSPDDETDEKLPFFAGVGVREVVVIDRDTKAVRPLTLEGVQYVDAPADPEGWIVSTVLRVRFRTAVAPPRLLLEDSIEPSVRVEI